MTAYTLNLLDLAFTLHALERGAVEANPAIWKEKKYDFL